MGRAVTLRVVSSVLVLGIASVNGLTSTTSPRTLTARIEKVSYVAYRTDYAWSFAVRVSNRTGRRLAFCSRMDYYLAKIVKDGRRAATVYDPNLERVKLATITAKDLVLVKAGESTTIEVMMGRGWFPKIDGGQMAIVFRGDAGLNRNLKPGERNNELAKFFKRNDAQMCELDFATNLIALPHFAGIPRHKS